MPKELIEVQGVLLKFGEANVPNKQVSLKCQSHKYTDVYMSRLCRLCESKRASPPHHDSFYGYGGRFGGGAGFV